MKHNETSSQLQSFETTRTMREKAQVFGRCVINIIKFWRLCRSKKDTKREQTEQHKNASSSRYA